MKKAIFKPYLTCLFLLLLLSCYYITECHGQRTTGKKKSTKRYYNSTGYYSNYKISPASEFLNAYWWAVILFPLVAIMLFVFAIGMIVTRKQVGLLKAFQILFCCQCRERKKSNNLPKKNEQLKEQPVKDDFDKLDMSNNAKAEASINIKPNPLQNAIALENEICKRQIEQPPIQSQFDKSQNLDQVNTYQPDDLDKKRNPNHPRISTLNNPTAGLAMVENQLEVTQDEDVNTERSQMEDLKEDIQSDRKKSLDKIKEKQNKDLTQ